MDKLLQDIKTFFTDFEVTIKDLQSPSPIYIRDFYIRALLELDVDDENVRKLQLTQSDVDQEEVELIPELNLVTAVKEAFPYNDIGLLDLLIPNQKRTYQHIRNIMNFLAFADTLVSNLNPHLANFQAMEEKMNELNREKDAYSVESNNLALQKNDLVRTKKELEEFVAETQEQVQLIKQEIDELSSKKKAADEMLEKKNMITLSLTQELQMKERQIEELKNELVEHPEIDQNNLKERENQLAKLKHRREEAEASLKEKKNQKLKLKPILEVVNEKLLPTCSSIVEDIKKIRGHEQQLIDEERERKRLLAIKERITEKKIDLGDNIVSEERRKMKLLEEWQQAEAELRKSIGEKESKYVDELTKFKASKKDKKKLEDVNKQIEGIKNRVAERKNMFDELHCCLDKKDKEIEEFIFSFSNEVKSREEKFLDLKKEFDNFKRSNES